MIERYLKNAPMLKCVFLLVDIRHEASENDRLMYQWILSNGYHPVIIATKVDKLKRSQIAKQVRLVRESIGLEKEGILFPFSALTKQGREEIWQYVENILADSGQSDR